MGHSRADDWLDDIEETRALRAEIERLRALLAEARCERDERQAKFEAACREIERLRAALKPFARLCAIFPPLEWKDLDALTRWDADGDHDLTIGDLRSARAAFEQSTANGDVSHDPACACAMGGKCDCGADEKQFVGRI